jgi:hypothetical protein
MIGKSGYRFSGKLTQKQKSPAEAGLFLFGS